MNETNVDKNLNSTTDDREDDIQKSFHVKSNKPGF